MNRDPEFNIYAIAAKLAAEEEEPEGFDPSEVEGLDENEKDLQTILQTSNGPAFAKWVAENKYLGSNETHDLFSDIFVNSPYADSNKRVYQKLMQEQAGALAKLITYNEMPTPICGSELQNFGVKYPHEFIAQLPIEQLLDEYFGLIYHPYREDLRYDDGKGVMQKLVKQHVPDVGKLLSMDSDPVGAGLSLTEVSDIDEIYGQGAVENWIKANGYPKTLATWGAWEDEFGKYKKQSSLKKADTEEEIPDGFDPSELEELDSDEQDIQMILSTSNQPAFVQWVENNSDLGYSETDKLFSKLFKESPYATTNKKAYQHLIVQSAAALGNMIEQKKHMPWPICGSVLSNYGIKTLLAFVDHLPGDQLLDEYFGICYHPRRDGERFPAGAKDYIIQLIRKKFPEPGSILGSSDPLIYGGLVVSGPEDIDAIYGPNASLNWVKQHGYQDAWEAYSIWDGEFDEYKKNKGIEE
jgi:hypothetical protein